MAEAPPALLPAASWRYVLDRNTEALVPEPHRGAVNHPPGQLPTRGVDVISAGATHGREHSTPDELVAKLLDDRQRRAPIAGARKRVEGDQIHLRRMAREQAR